MKILILFLLFSVVAFSQKKDSTFRFIAFGDMPYYLPQDYLRLENVVNEINKIKPEFSVFVGDFKASKIECTNKVYQDFFQIIKKIDQPLIYTPGDNEWTDCHGYRDTIYNPEERLSYVRKLFFDDSKGLGKQKINLLSEAKSKGFEKYIENYYWKKHHISFATFHIVGSNNNLPKDTLADKSEYEERNKANIYWLNNLFIKAKYDNALGIVLITHADMFTYDKGGSGFTAFLNTLREQCIAYGKPVLLINGDSHKFLIDKPLTTNERKTILNFTRLQVFGEIDMHAVEIVVNTENPNLFEIQPLIIPNN